MFRHLLYLFEILLVGCGYLFAALWFDFDRRRKRQRYDVRKRGFVTDKRAKIISRAVWILCIATPALVIVLQIVFGFGDSLDQV